MRNSTLFGLTKSLWLLGACMVVSLGCARGLPLSFARATQPLQQEAKQQQQSSTDSSPSPQVTTSPVTTAITTPSVASSSDALSGTRPQAPMAWQTGPAAGEALPGGAGNPAVNNPAVNNPSVANSVVTNPVVTNPVVANQIVDSALTAAPTTAAPTTADMNLSLVDLASVAALAQPAAVRTRVGPEPGTVSMASFESSNPGVSQGPALEPSAPQRSVHIIINNVQTKRGKVRVAVFTNAAKFPNSASKGLTATLAADTSSMAVTIPLSEVAMEQAKQGNGSVAVAVYQDINGDGQLNRNGQGVPLEPCAFSRSAMGRRGPPTFEQAAVPLDLGSSSNLANIDITLPDGL